MVKFGFRKQLAMGLLAAATVFGTGALAVSAIPSVVAWAEGEADAGETAKAVKTIGFGSASEDGSYSLTINTENLPGNYVYVAYYDTNGKLKSTTTFHKDEVQGHVSLGNLNLKKGGSFKVYSEALAIDKVEEFKVAAQAGKVKVKIKDLAEDDFFKAVEITVDSGTTLTAANWNDYAISLYPYFSNPGSPDSSVADELNKYWANCKTNAKIGGLTLNVIYGGAMETVDNQKVAPNGLKSQAKVKVKAAPKAPKVTVDYVYGNYVIPKGANYLVTTVGEDGVAAAFPAKGEDGKIAGMETAAQKVTLSIDDIIKKAYPEAAAADGDATAKKSAAVIVWTEKAKAMKSVEEVIKVTELDAATAAAATGDEKQNVTVTVGETTIAELTFSATGVIIDPKADIAYYDSAKSKWVLLKTGKKTTKEIAVAKGSKISIKAVGTKPSKTVAAKFGSQVVEVTNEFTAKPTTTQPTTTQPTT